MTRARPIVRFAGWFLLAASPAALWWWATGRLMPWWGALAIGAALFAASEVGGRKRG